MKINPHAAPEVKEIQSELIEFGKQLKDRAFKNDLSSMGERVSALEQKFEAVLKTFQTGILPSK